MRLTRNSAVHFSNKAATRFTSNSMATIKKFLACAKRGSDCGCGHGPKSGPAKTGPAVPLATPMPNTRKVYITFLVMGRANGILLYALHMINISVGFIWP